MPIVDARADLGGAYRVANLATRDRRRARGHGRAAARSRTIGDAIRLGKMQRAPMRRTARHSRSPSPSDTGDGGEMQPERRRARGGALDGARGLSGRSASHGSGDERRAASIARAAATEDRIKRQISRLNANFEGLPTGGGHNQAKLPIGGALARPRRRRVCNWRRLHPPALRGRPLVSR